MEVLWKSDLELEVLHTVVTRNYSIQGLVVGACHSTKHRVMTNVQDNAPTRHSERVLKHHGRKGSRATTEHNIITLYTLATLARITG